ncbi:MAG: polysaccharide deacetylase family protein [Hamadaea sp.]|nr:polysaccharide deacetylase family protein [Hamadaea sp.]
MPVSRARTLAEQARGVLQRLRPALIAVAVRLGRRTVETARRLRTWAGGSSVLSPFARRSVATLGFIVILCVAVVASWLTTGPATDRSASQPSAAASPSASPSPSAKPSPSLVPARKVDTSKPAKGTLMTRTGTAAVTLTFDDGPHATWTPRILDQLRAAGVKATFCLIGRQVKAHAALVRRMVAEGHTLCNHSWSHDLKLGRRTDVEIRADIQRTDAAILAVAPGAKIKYFRQPGGNFTAGEVQIVKAMGKIPLSWSVDPWDWASPGVEQIISRVLAHTRPGGIVLLHDGGGDRSQTLAAVKRLLPVLKTRCVLRALPS